MLAVVVTMGMTMRVAGSMGVRLPVMMRKVAWSGG